MRVFEGEANSDPTAGKSSPSAISAASRRSFLGVLLGLGSVFMGTLLAVPLMRFALFPLLRRTTQLKSSPVGDLSEFTSLTEPVMRTVQIEQVDGWRKAVSEKAVYVVKDTAGQLAVLSSICPHLGCSLPWVDEKSEFVCPCHLGRFAQNGKLLGGPPPRGMDLLESRVENGVLQVHYQYFRQLVPFKEVIG